MNKVTLEEVPAWLSLSALAAVVTLTRPSNANGVQVETLTLRAPVVREVRAADRASNSDEVQRELMLFAGLVEVGIKDLEDLKLADYRRVQAAYSYMVPDTDYSDSIPPWLSVNTDRALVTLTCPSVINGVSVDTLALRSPTVRDVRTANRDAGGDDEQRELILLAALAGAPVADLEGLKLADFNRLQAGYFRMDQEDGV
ncbi:phage tail assembly protein [Pseudomonas sp. BCA14]|uniref:phage tail assembly protein n=1 Tax=unclassified Pseudomonas TaxID=196821 RepID=UPI00106DD381|nr:MULTISPECIES: phage tail assembly protein [unclassified Pseudomonas]TFF14294.1 phage tail assembly protein [Pseudomonas sp. JMN1]TFF15022.1 phage tail assembly protein [Pseudomonas sp. BCA17]TFF31428.1 phage tail assembly protein [Pseudomonas sp. BCA14]TFF32382.1 phage tail assembly protein [Pseudomonas sp. BCA13]